MARLVNFILLKLSDRSIIGIFRELAENPNIFPSELIQIINQLKQARKSDYILKISRNPHFKFQDVLDKPNNNWNWKELSKNPSITMDMVKKHQELKWEYQEMVFNPNLTEDYLTKELAIKIYIWRNPECRMGCNYIMDREDNDMQDCTCYDKYFKNLVKNPNISFVTAKKYSPNILISDTIRSIRHTPDKYDNPENYPPGYFEERFTWLYMNPYLTIDYIRKNKTENWNWETLTMHPNIHQQDILNSPDLPWPKEIILKPYYLNPNTTPETLIKYGYMEKHQWVTASKNPNVSIEYIMKNRHLPWDWESVSLNPNLTFDIILNNQSIVWYYINIIQNLMTFHPELYKIRIKKYIQLNSKIINQLSPIIIQYV